MEDNDSDCVNEELPEALAQPASCTFPKRDLQLADRRKQATSEPRRLRLQL